VVIAALLGADEWSFGTAALIAVVCKMARSCHSNTCPVGVATQRADLIAKFPGKPENLIIFMHQVAEEVRQLLASPCSHARSPGAQRSGNTHPPATNIILRAATCLALQARLPAAGRSDQPMSTTRR
jgi:hypothetical protein